jgi:hypothetical protein
MQTLKHKQVTVSDNSVLSPLAMAVLVNGSLVGWGLDSDDRIASAVAAFTSGAISAVSAAVCTAVLVLDSNGTVRGFGNNHYGTLTPQAVGLGPVADIHAGLFFGAARLQDGGVRLWGRVEAAVLPPALVRCPVDVLGSCTGTSWNPAVLIPGWSETSSPSTRSASSIPVHDVTMGVHHTVVVLPHNAASGSAQLNASTVISFGAEFLGGESACFYDGMEGSRQNHESKWTQLAFSGEGNDSGGFVLTASAGSNHTLLLIGPAGRVVSYGSAADGMSDADVPAAARSGVMAISAGWGFSVALKADGRTLLVWGNASTLEKCGLAYGGNASAIVSGLGLHMIVGQGASDVQTLDSRTTVQALAAGGEHVLLLLSNGSVQAFGCSAHGQATVPTALQQPTAGAQAVSIAAGGAHSVVLLRSGRVLAWGANDMGQTDRQIADLTEALAVGAGPRTTVVQVTRGSMHMRTERPAPYTKTFMAGSNTRMLGKVCLPCR